MGKEEMKEREGQNFEALRVKLDFKKVVSGKGKDFHLKAWHPADSKPANPQHLLRIR